MSVEVETTEPATPAPTATRPVLLRDQPARPPLWRRRWAQVGAVVLVLALIGGYIANNFLARQYSPEGAVRQYLGALQSADAKMAWSLIQVTAPTQPTAAALLDEPALAGALASGKPDIGGFQITGTTDLSSSSAAVDIVYDTGAGSKPGRFITQRTGENQFLIYPGWHIAIAPTLLQIDLPKGSAGVSIDGKSVALPDGKSTVAVLPLAHKIDFAGTGVLAAQSLSVDDFLATGSPLPYQPKLSGVGVTSATAAVKAYFENCVLKTGPAPAGCPQTYNNNFASSVQWQLVGDPTADLTLDFDSDLNLVGSGHYQMVVSYQEGGVTGTSHDVASGGYSVSFGLASSGLSVAAISASGNAQSLQRPAGATDAAATSLVASALGTCASLVAAAPADCPQRLLSPLAQRVRWTLTGDPTSGADVAFDPKTGVLTVHGQFSMNATYTLNGYSSSSPSYFDHYYATLLWDGQALRLVTIAGGFS